MRPAAALIFCREQPQHLAFPTTDQHLRNAANLEGFPVEQPDKNGTCDYVRSSQHTSQTTNHIFWHTAHQAVVRPPIVARSSGVPSRGHFPPRRQRWRKSQEAGGRP